MPVSDVYYEEIQDEASILVSTDESPNQLPIESWIRKLICKKK